MLEEIVLSAEQLKCLSSPVRNDAYVRLRAMGRASAREIAAALGKAPSAVHYHLVELEKAGLIVEAFRRPSPRKPESVYEPAARRLKFPPVEHDPALRTARREAAMAQIRRMSRQFEAASLAAEEDENLKKVFQVIQLTARLSPGDLAEFQGMLRAAAEFAESKRSEDGIPLRWSSVLVPLI